MLTENQYSFGKRANLFWGNIRTTYQLFETSKWTNHDVQNRLNEQLACNLAKGILIYPPALKYYGIGQETPYRLRRKFLGHNETYIPMMSEDDLEKKKRFDKQLKQNQFDRRKRNWRWRVQQHAMEMQEKGWHPFFVTLTVDPKLADPYEIWKPGSREFQLYIRRLCKIVTDTLGLSPCNKPPYRPQEDFITYMGRIEHGKSREHHHGHFLIWMREIPAHWKLDPNAGKKPSERTEAVCDPLRAEWPWATHEEAGKPLYFRSTGDIWSRCYGHVVPVSPKSGQPVEIQGIEAAGAYITKYLEKDENEWSHRVKATRNLGLRKLRQQMMAMSPDQLEALSWRPETETQYLFLSKTHSVPSALIRQEAKLMHFSHSLASRQLDLETLLKPNYESYPAMLQSVKGGARPDRMPFSELCDWLYQRLQDQTGFCEKRFKDAHSAFAKNYPPPKFVPKPIVIGANKVGNS